MFNISGGKFYLNIHYNLFSIIYDLRLKTLFRKVTSMPIIFLKETCK